MENKQLALVNGTQALKLRDAGFDWPCPDVFKDGKTIEGEYSRPDILRPTVALALKWMRDVKHINYQIDSDVLWNEDNGKHEKLWRSGRGNFMLISTGWKKSYEDTESALLDELLTLIEK